MNHSSGIPERYGPARITRIIAIGSLCVASTLTTLLLAYDIVHNTPLRIRFWAACSVIVYLFIVIYLVKRHQVTIANWMIILLYEALAALILIHWGLSSSVGILTASFAVLLPGILMAPRSIFPVSLVTLSVIAFAHTLHASGVVVPVPYIPTNPSSFLDLLAYITILAVFGLVSWISARQSSLSLHRALKAEENLKKQKNMLATELEKESSRLRQIQLEQIQQLYKFAAIGQSATATLHELSNHLSVLNLDIDDIKQQHKHSKAIASAEKGIEYINRMVRKVRSQLSTTEGSVKVFNVIPVINRTVKDMKHKFNANDIKLIVKTSDRLLSFRALGDPANLSQCISIILNNAFDACKSSPSSRVTIAVSLEKHRLSITISDNGPGLDKEVRKKIFQPLESTKPTGLGVGLFIAKHLITSQFAGTLDLLESKSGAKFVIQLNEAPRRAFTNAP